MNIFPFGVTIQAPFQKHKVPSFHDLSRIALFPPEKQRITLLNLFEKSSAIAFHYRTQLILTILGGTRKLKIAEIDQLLSFPIAK